MHISEMTLSDLHPLILNLPELNRLAHEIQGFPPESDCPSCTGKGHFAAATQYCPCVRCHETGRINTPADLTFPDVSMSDLARFEAAVREWVGRDVTFKIEHSQHGISAFAMEVIDHCLELDPVLIDLDCEMTDHGSYLHEPHARVVAGLAAAIVYGRKG